MMSSDAIFSTLFGQIDNLGAQAVQTLYQQLAQSIQPAFMTGLALYIILWGWAVIYGRTTITASAFAWQVARALIIDALAFTWSDFSSTISDVLINTPNSIASAVCSAVGGQNCSSSDTSMGDSLENIWKAGEQVAQNVSAAGGYTGVGLMIMGLLILVIVGLFVVYAAYLIVMGKIALFVLLGLAPFFIALALFNVTAPLTDGWFRTAVHYALVPVVVYGFLGFFIVLINDSMTQLTGAAGGGQTPNMKVIGPFLIMLGVGTMVLTQSLAITAAIAGGRALDPGRFPTPGGVLAWAGGAVTGRAIRAATGAARGAMSARNIAQAGGAAAAGGGAASSAAAMRAALSRSR